MADYRLRYLDPTRQFIRADRIACDSEAEAIDAAYDRRLPVRSELWRGGYCVAKLPAHRQLARARAEP